LRERENERPQKFSFFVKKDVENAKIKLVHTYIGEFLVLLIVTKIILAISLFIYLIAINNIEVTCKKFFVFVLRESFKLKQYWNFFHY